MGRKYVSPNYDVSHLNYRDVSKALDTSIDDVAEAIGHNDPDAVKELLYKAEIKYGFFSKRKTKSKAVIRKYQSLVLMVEEYALDGIIEGDSNDFSDIEDTLHRIEANGYDSCYAAKEIADDELMRRAAHLVFRVGEYYDSIDELSSLRDERFQRENVYSTGTAIIPGGHGSSLATSGGLAIINTDKKANGKS